MRFTRSSSNFAALIVAVAVVGVLVILSPAYLHFTKSGAEFGATPDAPANPHSDAICDQVYATYRSQIDGVQAERQQISDRIAKADDPSNVADQKAELTRLDAQALDLNTQGMQARDDCYVKVANWQTEQKTAEAQRYAAAAKSTPQAGAGTPIAAAAVLQPAQAPTRAYAKYASTAQPVVAPETTASPSMAHKSAHRRGYAWSHHRTHRSVADEPQSYEAASLGSGPHVAVATYDRTLVADAAGVVSIPSDGTSGYAVAEARPDPYATLASASSGRHRRHHGARKILVSTQFATPDLIAPPQTPAAVTSPQTAPDMATAPATPTIQPATVSVPSASGIHPDVPLPLPPGRTTSGTDPPAGGSSKQPVH